MKRMLVVIFDAEAKAIKGKGALLQLDDEGLITVYDHAIVQRNADGATTVKKEDDTGPLGTLAGMELGSLIGLPSGPIGLAVGAAVGSLSGSTVDLHRTLIGKDFVADVTRQLTLNRFAVVAEIEEDSTAVVDSQMESVGGIVFRRALSDVKQTLHDENVADMKANLALMKAALAQAHDDHRAKLQEKINKLESKIREQMTRVKERSRAEERRDKAEVDLKTKASALNESLQRIA